MRVCDCVRACVRACACMSKLTLYISIPVSSTVCVDLSDWAATRKAVEELRPIDLLVNNAAVISLVSFFETDEKDLDKYEVILHYTNEPLRKYH